MSFGDRGWVDRAPAGREAVILAQRKRIAELEGQLARTTDFSGALVRGGTDWKQRAERAEAEARTAETAYVEMDKRNLTLLTALRSAGEIAQRFWSAGNDPQITHAAWDLLTTQICRELHSWHSSNRALWEGESAEQEAGGE